MIKEYFVRLLWTKRIKMILFFVQDGELLHVIRGWKLNRWGKRFCLSTSFFSSLSFSLFVFLFFTVSPSFTVLLLPSFFLFLFLFVSLSAVSIFRQVFKSLFLTLPQSPVNELHWVILQFQCFYLYNKWKVFSNYPSIVNKWLNVSNEAAPRTTNIL